MGSHLRNGSQLVPEFKKRSSLRVLRERLEFAPGLREAVQRIDRQGNRGRRRGLSGRSGSFGNGILIAGGELVDDMSLINLPPPDCVGSRSASQVSRLVHRYPDLLAVLALLRFKFPAKVDGHVEVAVAIFIASLVVVVQNHHAAPGVPQHFEHGGDFLREALSHHRVRHQGLDAVDPNHPLELARRIHFRQALQQPCLFIDVG